MVVVAGRGVLSPAIFNIVAVAQYTFCDNTLVTNRPKPAYPVAMSFRAILQHPFPAPHIVMILLC